MILRACSWRWRRIYAIAWKKPVQGAISRAQSVVLACVAMNAGISSTGFSIISGRLSKYYKNGKLD